MNIKEDINIGHNEESFEYFTKNVDFKNKILLKFGQFDNYVKKTISIYAP